MRLGVATLSRLPYLDTQTTHVIFTKQIIQQKCTCSGVSSGFEVLTAHSTEKYCISFFVYSRLPSSNLQWSIAQSFLPQICIMLEDVLLRLHTCTLYLAMQNSLQGGHSFELTLTLYRNWTKNVGGKCCFTRVWYICHYNGRNQNFFVRSLKHLSKQSALAHLILLSYC